MNARSVHFNDDHETFRDTVRRFVTEEVRPQAERWEADRRIPRAIWPRMGELGLLGVCHEETYGGSGADLFYAVVLLEEIAQAGLGGFSAAVGVHEFMATAHIAHFGSSALKQRYLPAAIAGEKIGALAISEPACGSDVANLATRARRDGDCYVIDGAKTFITNGCYSDFITVAVKTDPEAGYGGVSLLVVDRDSPGLSANKLDKMGWHCSDTAELFFDSVRVPTDRLVGEENRGFYYVMKCFELERLVAAIGNVAGAAGCIQETLAYMRERKAFGKPIVRYQALRHRLTQLIAETESLRHFVYHTTWLLENQREAVAECAMAKMLSSELLKRTTDECLQMYGGYGFMSEYPISRYYRDARVGTIVGGTTEIMHEIIGKTHIDGVRLNLSEAGSAAPAAVPPAPAAGGDLDVPALMALAPGRFRPEQAADWQARFHFDFSDDGQGTWTAVVDGGSLTVREGLEGEPTCLVRCKGALFLAIERGKTSPEAAFMTGRLKVSSIPEMLRFRRCFKRLEAPDAEPA